MPCSAVYRFCFSLVPVNMDGGCRTEVLVMT